MGVSPNISEQTPALRANGISTTHQRVAILDCGAQYTKVIDRRVRELNVYSDIIPLETSLDVLKTYQAIIISGGPDSVFEPGAPSVDAQVFQLGIPVLGICYGMQLMAHALGGHVEPGTTKEYGETALLIDPSLAPIFTGLDEQQWVLMSHGDHVATCPDGFEVLARSGSITAAMGDTARRLYGLQFHPEVELSQQGPQMIKNFLYNVAGLTGDFPLTFRLDQLLDAIRAQAGSRPVVTLVSGGVDSAVTTALLLKALSPDQVYALHVDTGFMRLNESETVCQALTQLGLTHLTHIKAQDQFLSATTTLDDGQVIGPLGDIINPEHKRRIIGDVFYQLTQELMQSLKLDLNQTLIAQGTLRPDLIESGNKDVSVKANTIKTHHNDVPIIQQQREKGLIIETNRDFHKDEVRQLGRMLGLSDDIVSRQPFPGPGLAIRTLCTSEPFLDPNTSDVESQMHALIGSPTDIQTKLLPVRSVGVQGDFRTYRHLAVIAGNYPQDGERLRQWASAIPNHVAAVNRVALVLEPNRVLPDTLNQITPTTLTPKVLDLLRQVDDTVLQAFQKANLMSTVSQLLTVLVPVDTHNQNHHSVAIRAVVTSDYMTARPVKIGTEVPWSLLLDLDATIRRQFPIDMVMVDLTGKPPATIEWE